MKTFTADNREFYVGGKLIKVCGLVNAWYESIENPESLVISLKQDKTKKHIFTFFQRPPHTEPKFNYYTEPYSIAVIKLTSYDNWWNHGIGKYPRQAVKRSQRHGVEIRKVEFDDDFVNGISGIFNDSPIRLGKKFRHYNKSIEEVRKEVGTFIDRSIFLGAYWRGELVGYAKIVIEDEFADLLNLIIKLSHREKCITNGLLAKVVEVCCDRRIGYIAYGDFDSSTLGDFKRHNGFSRMDVPRYFVPLNFTGAVALRLGLHRPFAKWLPDWMLPPLKEFRKKWHERKIKDKANSALSRESAAVNREV
jgi:hypothetical protein